MADIAKIPLISSEITGLWNSYMSDSIIVTEFKYYINTVRDKDTCALLQYISDLANQHLVEVTNIFNEEKLPIPAGFTDSDVNINAPSLFTDGFYLHYLGYMARVAMHNYTLILNEIARVDMRTYFEKRINEGIELYNRSAELRLSKGIFIRAPQADVSKEVQFIKNQSFMLDWFGEKRPLLTRELTHIFVNIFSNIIGRATSIGFGQVAKEKKVSEISFKGCDLATEQISGMTTILTKEDIPIPSSFDSYVTDSTVAPFSDKLILNHLLTMCSSGISSLGMAIADSMRSDLQTKYIGYIAQIMKYAKDCADIGIDNGWLEQPPQVIKHENLVGSLK